MLNMLRELSVFVQAANIKYIITIVSDVAFDI